MYPFSVGGSFCYAQKVCPPLTDEDAAKLIRYVSDKYELSPDLTMEDEGTDGRSCFRRIKFDSAEPIKSLTLFLSEDHNYLTSELLDLMVDPAVARRQQGRLVSKLLNAKSSPTRGLTQASVSIVVFSDFECPFCKNLEKELSSLPPAIQREIQVTFKQLPLSMHPWARSAAMATSCVHLQGNDAFWKLHDFLFDNQTRLNEHNFDAIVGQFLVDSQLDPAAWRQCVQARELENVLNTDERLAIQIGVHSTPTIFINGLRRGPFSSSLELQFSIEQALNDVKFAHEYR